MKTKVKTFTVKRSRWHRGQGSARSYLCLDNGKKCCLGFLGSQCRVRIKDMLNVGLPGDIQDEFRNKFPYIINDDWSLFTVINDSMDIADHERELRLKELAKKHGFRFKFVP